MNGIEKETKLAAELGPPSIPDDCSWALAGYRLYLGQQSWRQACCRYLIRLTTCPVQKSGEPPLIGPG